MFDIINVILFSTRVRGRSSFRVAVVICAALCLLASCRRGPETQRPIIQFSRIPEANPGGRETQDIIEGFACGGKPGEQIVLYAKSGQWWVQPLTIRPFTELSGPPSKMKWTNVTHLGTDYAALLVEPEYHPQPVLDDLPKQGGPAGAAVLAVARTKGAASPPSKIVAFSGYEWRLRDAPSLRGGIRNQYSSENISVDATGAMHMKVARVGNDWTCAEASLTRSLGYGRYSVTVREASNLPGPAVFSMFTWDYARPDENYGEMDMEYRRWPDRKENFQYVVPPHYAGQNAVRAFMPAATLIHSLDWAPGRAAFQSARVSNGSTVRVAEAIFTSSVPVHGIESFRMCLYINHYLRLQPSQNFEVVIEKFEYLP